MQFGACAASRFLRTDKKAAPESRTLAEAIAYLPSHGLKKREREKKMRGEKAEVFVESIPVEHEPGMERGMLIKSK